MNPHPAEQPAQHSGYQIVQLANGARTVRSLAHGETFHPVVGPVAEAEALYVRQLRLRERIQAAAEEFVIWDVGLGAAANPITLLRALARTDAHRPAVKIVSFDCTAEPLEFALGHAASLGYLEGFEEPLRALLRSGQVEFETAHGVAVNWRMCLADFPALVQSSAMAALPKPHAIFYDAFSPARNAAMWTLPVFAALYQQLDPGRPCAMPTYSRSTLLRVTLLLAGFFVGQGHATGEKEETTVAANTPALIDQPLDGAWLGRARRSRSAEPLHSAEYRQAPLSDRSWEALRAHPQFRNSEPPPV